MCTRDAPSALLTLASRPSGKYVYVASYDFHGKLSVGASNVSLRDVTRPPTSRAMFDVTGTPGANPTLRVASSSTSRTMLDDSSPPSAREAAADVTTGALVRRS